MFVSDETSAPANVETCDGFAHSAPPHATTLVGMYLPELKNAPRFATSW